MCTNAVEKHLKIFNKVENVHVFGSNGLTPTHKIWRNSSTCAPRDVKNMFIALEFVVVKIITNVLYIITSKTPNVYPQRMDKWIIVYLWNGIGEMNAWTFNNISTWLNLLLFHAKNTSCKKTHPVWYHLYKSQQQAKLNLVLKDTHVCCLNS